MTLENQNYLEMANLATRRGDYELAVALNKKALESKPAFYEVLQFNIDFNSKKLVRGTAAESTYNIPRHTKDASIVENYPIWFDTSNHRILTSQDRIELELFGASFLGPVIYRFFKELGSYLSDNPDVECIHFLAREGYLLGDMFGNLVSLGHIRPVGINYLLCSRTLLFKLSLAREDLRAEVLQHHYSGTLRKLLSDRFKFTDTEISTLLNASDNSSSILDIEIRLPHDANLALDFLSSLDPDLTEIVEPKRSAYHSYLESVATVHGDDRTFHVADIGYSGTIQKLLSKFIPDNNFVGHYMFTTNNAKADCQNEFIGHILDKVSFGNGHTLLDRSLFMETLLTAPHGQVIDVASLEEIYQFKFGENTAAQRNFHILRIVCDGALRYVRHAFDNNLRWDQAELEATYQIFVKYQNMIPKKLLDVFEIDDTISGFGTLNPVDFFNNKPQI